MRHIFLWLFLALVLYVSGGRALAQTAQVSGQVTDPQKAAIPNADIRIVDQATGVEERTKTNNAGYFVAPFLQPGRYKLFVQALGFDTSVSNELILTVGQALALNFQMRVGSTQEQVTVNAGDQQINTSDASVSTVVDRKFVETMPLNGRSFQSLILLAPGVLTTSPQDGTGNGITGEFSVNGQRTDGNGLSVDGLSANNGVYTTAGSAGNSGGLASSTALGTTQALVSVDALQEFRITTSSYSAEYGRQPGAQIEFQTRSGTNDFHGTLFDYFRNDALDANNWFNDDNTPIIAKPAERQNDFGGVLGGPIQIPRLYSGKDRAFFFFSYEGLRLTQPQPATVQYVPSNGTNNTAVYPDPRYENLRANAPAALQPVLNSFPKPNCTLQENPQCIDYGDGFSPYVVSTSLPSDVNSISGRFDYQVKPWLRLFFRYADTTSAAVSSVTTYVDSLNYRTLSLSFGADSTISSSISNQFRLGYSPTHGIQTESGVTLGGAVPASLNQLQNFASGFTDFAIFPANGEEIYNVQSHSGTPQHQWNAIDTVSWAHGTHVFHFGIDYRRTTSYQNLPDLSSYPEVIYEYLSAATVLQNNMDFGEVAVSTEQDPAFTNFSAFVQDEWHVRPRVSLSLGLRWELNPPPTVVGGKQQGTLYGSLADPASITLAPAGTPLYKTTYYNFAPRLGVAVTLRNQPGRETVFRTGGGVYFDTGQSFYELYGLGDSPGLGGYGEYAGTSASPVPFPFSADQFNVPLSLTPPYSRMDTVSRSLQLPYTFQWNASLEQALGASQSLTLGYVGSNGRRLLARKVYDLTGLNPDFTTIEIYQNGLSSSYNSLQVQYKRTLSHHLQALAAYTWSHAFDINSQDAFTYDESYQRGNSDFDVRNNFTAALSYSLPDGYSGNRQKAIFGGWGTDLRFTARTAFPVQLQGPEEIDLLGDDYYSALNYNGTNPYIYKPGIPGGRQYNPAAFSVPLTGESGNSPRNFLRGFGENEVNLALRREFPLFEQLHLQFRAEAFNLFNHPNFGIVNTTCGNSTPGGSCNNPLMGQATGTLASSLGGGLTQLYQQGGPRSIQLALKLTF